MARASELDRIREYIERELAPGEVTIERDTPLVEAGILDSASIVSLLEFVEEELGVAIPASEADPRNLETLDDIERLLERLPGRADAPAR